jgi:hypothetical protein
MSLPPTHFKTCTVGTKCTHGSQPTGMIVRLCFRLSTLVLVYCVVQVQVQVGRGMPPHLLQLSEYVRELL